METRGRAADAIQTRDLQAFLVFSSGTLKISSLSDMRCYIKKFHQFLEVGGTPGRSKSLMMYSWLTGRPTARKKQYDTQLSDSWLWAESRHWISNLWRERVSLDTKNGLEWLKKRPTESANYVSASGGLARPSLLVAAWNYIGHNSSSFCWIPNLGIKRALHLFQEKRPRLWTVRMQIQDRLHDIQFCR